MEARAGNRGRRFRNTEADERRASGRGGRARGGGGKEKRKEKEKVKKVTSLGGKCE